MSDPYTNITSQSEETLEACARILELRAKESQQVRLRWKILQNVSGRVLEVGSKPEYSSDYRMLPR